MGGVGVGSPGSPVATVLLRSPDGAAPSRGSRSSSSSDSESGGRLSVPMLFLVKERGAESSSDALLLGGRHDSREGAAPESEADLVVSESDASEEGESG